MDCVHQKFTVKRAADVFFGTRIDEVGLVRKDIEELVKRMRTKISAMDVLRKAAGDRDDSVTMKSKREKSISFSVTSKREKSSKLLWGDELSTRVDKKESMFSSCVIC